MQLSKFTTVLNEVIAIAGNAEIIYFNNGDQHREIAVRFDRSTGYRNLFETLDQFKADLGHALASEG